MRLGHEAGSGERTGGVGEKRVRRLDDLSNQRREVGSVVLGIVRGRGNVIAVAMPAQIEEYAAILAKLASDERPDPAVAAVPCCGWVAAELWLRRGCGCRPDLSRFAALRSLSHEDLLSAGASGSRA
jgi:hypothetical protein